jgi:hypothetical protein
LPGLTWIADALVVPCSGRPRDGRGWFLDGGIYDAEGRLVPACQHRGELAQHVAPAQIPRTGLPTTPGRFVFGGWLQRHFGHLLITLGRLWALRDLEGQVEGVVFLRLPDDGFHRPAHGPHRLPMVAELLACLGTGGGGPAVRLVAAPTRFEQLAMPDQILFGAAETCAADNAAWLATLRRMRDAPRVRHGLVLPRLYVSRRRLRETLGRYLFEDMLEENLAAEGYAIMYPECLGIAEQVAAYAAARQVIFAESSALHLAIGQIDPDTPVAVIARRRPMAARLQREIAAADLRRASRIDAIEGAVVALDGRRISAAASFAALALLNFAALRAELVAAGLCHGRNWRLPTGPEIEARIAEAIATRRKLMPNTQVRYITADQLAGVAALDHSAGAAPA